jgi:hypothetical protein
MRDTHSHTLDILRKSFRLVRNLLFNGSPFVHQIPDSAGGTGMTSTVAKGLFTKLGVLLLALALFDTLPETLWAQDVPLTLRSSRVNRRTGLHNGNRVRTKFTNTGLVGSRAFVAPNLPSLAWPVDENEYIFDLSLLVGLERVFRDTVLFTGTDTTALRGTRLRDNQTNTEIPRGSRVVPVVVNGQTRFAAVVNDTARYATTHQGPRASAYRVVNGQFEGFEPLSGFFNPAEEFPAMSQIPSSWPAFWPDQPTWINPLTRRAEWNGYFGRGIVNADQESYFVFDDATDQRWFNEYRFRPIQSDPTRYGAGLQVKARGLQWSNFLAQDNIFWLYEIRNISDFDYEKVFFGSVVGTAVGRQFQANVSVFDQSRSITYSWNPGGEVDGGWNRNFPVGYVGVAFLESPGNPFDGIDNDDDWNKIESGPLAIPNRSTPAQFAAIAQGQVSATGYDFIEIENNLVRGVFRGINAPRVVRRGDFLITITQIDTITPQMAAAGYTRPAVFYRRNAVAMPAGGTLTLTTLGQTRTIREGDTLRESSGNLIDDNFNGVIDEDYRLHYYRVQVEANILTQRSEIRRLPALRYIDYLALARSNEDLNDPLRFPLIDERRDDGIDNNGNWFATLDDLGADGRAGTLDRGESDARPTPGESSFDALDVRESDQIGLTSYKFDLSSLPQMGSSTDLFRITTPGVFDSLNFNPQDGDYTYGTGYFPLKRGQTERLSIATVYGQTAPEILTNKDIVQEIYDNNYSFAGPPRPEPKLTAVPSDKKVTLYWTPEAENYFDTFINRKITGGRGGQAPEAFTFEGYKVYKSTDPNFLDAFTISGGRGEERQRRAPIAQFDKIDSVFGYFPLSGRNLLNQARGVSFFLGEETGLSHTYTDNSVENGRTYYYAVVNYSKGYIDPRNPDASIFPSENSVLIARDTRGRLVFPPNVAAATPKAVEAGFVNPNAVDDTLRPAPGNRSAGLVASTFLNGRKITADRRIEVEFFDTANDRIDNNGNGLVDAADLIETLEPRTSYFQVRDITNPTQPKILLARSGETNNQLTAFLGDAKLYQTASNGSRFYRATQETALIDSLGLFFTIVNDVDIRPLAPVFRTRTAVPTANLPIVTIAAAAPSPLLNPANYQARSVKKPNDYAIVIGSGTSSAVTLRAVNGTLETLPARATNFRVVNLSTGAEQRYFLEPLEGANVGSSRRTSIFFIEQPQSAGVADTLFSWLVDIDASPRYTAQTGDTVLFRTVKPIPAGDRFTLDLKSTFVDENRLKNALDNVRVFPNPYIVTNTAEGNLQGADTRGRAERAIFFKNVPLRSAIRIYTIRGELVRTLQADNPSGTSVAFGNKDRLNDGGTFVYPTSQVRWDLKTTENLDVAYGVYLFHIDAPGVGTKTGKLAIIK